MLFLILFGFGVWGETLILLNIQNIEDLSFAIIQIIIIVSSIGLIIASTFLIFKPFKKAFLISEILFGVLVASIFASFILFLIKKPAEL
ncbi:MAG: hypothetical protein WBH31_17800 [Promethearchaeia archaeon]